MGCLKSCIVQTDIADNIKCLNNLLSILHQTIISHLEHTELQCLQRVSYTLLGNHRYITHYKQWITSVALSSPIHCLTTSLLTSYKTQHLELKTSQLSGNLCYSSFLNVGFKRISILEREAWHTLDICMDKKWL